MLSSVVSATLDDKDFITAEEDGFANICVNLEQPLERTLFITLLTAETGSAKGKLSFITYCTYFHTKSYVFT